MHSYPLPHRSSSFEIGASVARDDRAYISKEDRLMAMGEVFTLQDLSDSLGQSKLAASIYVLRWERSGLISKAGKRAGVYFNLLRNPEAGVSHLQHAVALKFPLAVRCGLSVLREHGWVAGDLAPLHGLNTPNDPQNVHKDHQAPELCVVVPAAAFKHVSLEGVDVQSRSAQWFELTHRALAEPKHPHALRSLSPAMALADLWLPRKEAKEVNEANEEGGTPSGREALDVKKVNWLQVDRAFKTLALKLPREYAAYVARAHVSATVKSSTRPRLTV